MAKGAKGSSYFKWNYSNSIIIRRKGFDKETNRFFAQTLYEYSYPYVPYDPYRDSGAHLADNVRIRANDDHGTITYQNKYANKIHEGSGMNFNKMIHPLATHHWEEFCWKQSKDQILAEVDAFRQRRATKNSRST